MNVQDLISLSIIPINIIPLILYFITHDKYHLIVGIGIWVTAKLSEYIKHHIIEERSPRPHGAWNCNMFCNDGDQAGKPGMPSSHAAASLFFVIMYWNHTKNSYVRALLLLYYLLIVQSRYNKKCHSIPQLIVGSMVGIGTSAFVLKYLVRHL